MATETSYVNSLPHFIADPGSVQKIPGRQIKWAAVSDTFIDAETGKKVLRAGQMVSEINNVSGDEGKIINYGGTDAEASPDETPTTAIGLLASDAHEDDPVESLSGYGVYVGGIVFENLLPQGPDTGLSAGEKTALSSGGATFKYLLYVDSRAG